MEYVSRGTGGSPMELPPSAPPPAPPSAPPPPAAASGGGGAAALGLLLALGACAGMAFVYFEPIVAFERLKSGIYNFPPTEQEWMMRGRMREAGIPLIASSAGAVLAFILGSAGKRKGAGKLAMFFALAALGAAGYVWAIYGDKIIRAL
jgi:hypothetical protein